VRAIEPRFGRLTVFDPRIPHGVRPVTGTHDPREGRLVIHGWFVQPRPFVIGPLATRELSAHAAELGALVETLPIAGMLALAFDVSPAGTVRTLRVLSDTTRVPRGDEPARRRFAKQLVRAVGAWTFSKRRASSRVVLPLVFERGV
jgi:hypothetical protein